MGSPKQLLDLNGRPMLQAVIESLIQSQVHGIAVVSYSDLVDSLSDALLPGTFVVINDDPDSEMIDSIRLALEAWYERDQVHGQDGFLICPGDQPGLTVSDFDSCINTFFDSPDRIVVASLQGKRGHPLIFPATFTEQINSRLCDQGLNALPHANSERVVEASLDSPAVIRNINTPEDYQNLT